MARDLFYKPVTLSSTRKLRSGSVPPVRLSSIIGSRASLAGQPTTTTTTTTRLFPSVRRLSVASSCASIQHPVGGIAWSKPDVRRTSFVGSGTSSVRTFSNNNLFSPSQVRTRSSIATSLNRPLAQVSYTALGNRKIFGLPVNVNTPLIPRKNTLDRRFSIPWNLNLTTTAHSKGYTPAKEYGVANSRSKGDGKPTASAAKTGRSSLAADTDPKDFKPRDTSRIGRVSKKSNYEDELQTITPIHEDSISKLRARAQIAKDHLCKHKILLDRYLPVHLGPDTDVVQEVENRYEELLSRMPRVQRRQRSNVEDEKYFTEIEPYKPAATTSRDRMLTEIKNVSVKKSFTPKISDTRKRARSVLCKVKGDPHYYDF